MKESFLIERHNLPYVKQACEELFIVRYISHEELESRIMVTIEYDVPAGLYYLGKHIMLLRRLDELKKN